MMTLLPLLLLTSPVVPTQELPQRMRALADAYHEIGMFQGAVLAGKGDEVLFRGAYGFADAEHGIENTPKTRFRLASVTKQFTATAALRLVELDKLRLTTTLGEAVPGFSSPVADVTLSELLSHSGGIVRDLDSLSPKGFGDEFSMPEMIAIVAGSDRRAGQGYAYSNAGYVMASAVIEQATGKPYGEAMRSLFFDRLGLKDTGHEITGPLFENRAFGYQRLPDGIANAPFENKSYVTGAGSMYSTVDDLWTWFRALRNGEVLTEASLKQLSTPHAGNYGYGWFVGDSNGFDDHVGERGKVVHHDGGCPGFATRVIRYLDHDVTVIALSNARPTSCGVLASALGDMAIGLDVRTPTASPDDVIARIAVRDGVAAAEERWIELRDSGAGPDALPSGSGVNNRGYRYLEANLPRKALALFELNAAMFPDQSGTWASLADGHAAVGERETAVELYSFAVALDPHNAAARARLEELGEAPR